MDNIKVMMEGNNFFIFLIVLVALMGFFVLVGNVIKTFRDIKKPKQDNEESIKTEIKELKNQVRRIETVMDDHGREIDDIRDTNRVLCQSIRALLIHALHDGNTEEIERAASALDDHLTKRI